MIGEENETFTSQRDVKKEQHAQGTTTLPKRLGKVPTAIICLCIFGVAAILLFLIFQTEPEAKKITAKRKSAMMVDVLEVERDTHRPILTAMGIVKPSREIVLSPRVNGEVLQLSSSFSPGGIVSPDEILVKIDPSDYQNTLKQRQSDELRAKAELELEMGRQDVAQKGYDLLDVNLNEENRDLVLRRPQLDTARAEVNAAQAALNQAQLDLERTTIKAPFHAQVVERMINTGSQVSSGSELGRLVGIDTYWIEATVPQSRLTWLRFGNDSNNEESVVQIKNRASWPKNTFREGSLDRLIGILEERSRLARVLITVDDPLLQKDKDSNLPPLMIGSFVEARIPLKELQDVVRLSRNHVRREDTVWVMKDDKLDIRSVEVIYRDSDHAYIQSGLEDGEKVVVSNLAAVVQGASLRIRSDSPDKVDSFSDTGFEGGKR